MIEEGFYDLVEDAAELIVPLFERFILKKSVKVINIINIMKIGFNIGERENIWWIVILEFLKVDRLQLKKFRFSIYRSRNGYNIELKW